MIKLEPFSEKTFEKSFRFPSAPLPPANFEEICVPKTENFPFLLKKKIGARKIKKMWENFSGFGVPKIRNGGSGKTSFILFIFLAVLDPSPPIRGRQQRNSLYLLSYNTNNSIMPKNLLYIIFLNFDMFS